MQIDKLYPICFAILRFFSIKILIYLWPYYTKGESMFFSFLLAAPLAFAEDFQSKDDWRNKMLSEERVDKHSGLMTSPISIVCTTPS